ncbi:hypothetical protein [Frigoriglobus tundricola]|uniref:Protein kinase n=1 Tax=Frigoriglobus tundricola TaxID=2774151 RepID=A0A6M5YSY4_9BACT|nr:hypothetical protein [Frigoriglobus tundricola]QJW96520.1 protein kinase [Frigoriglobus tundricola]
MRLIDVGAAPVRTITVSPNGRFVAAAGSNTFGVFDWHTGASVLRARDPGPCDQIAFGPNGD